MNELQVKRTTYKVDGIDEPCIIVDGGYAKVRIAKCYHLIGNDSLYVTEFLGGDYNSSDEISGDYNNLTDSDVIRIARNYSVYI